jgi:3D (Asp-Asp-Asp) domain-containing protein
MLKIYSIILLVTIGCLAGCNTAKGNEIVTKTVTAYCGCKKCCGQWSSGKKTADGHTPKQGVTIAASRNIPFGTRMFILGHIYTVQDRLAAKYDNRIDIYFTNHNEALKFGKRTIKVEIIK